MQSTETSLRLRPSRPGGRVDTDLADGPPPQSQLPVANQIAELGAKHVDGYPQAGVSESLTNAPTTAHLLGGAVIADCPERGVVDRYRRAFGYLNFLITEGSTVPANVGVNPGLTITAMAVRNMTCSFARGRWLSNLRRLLLRARSDRLRPTSCGATRWRRAGRSDLAQSVRHAFTEVARLGRGKAGVPRLDPWSLLYANSAVTAPPVGRAQVAAGRATGMRSACFSGEGASAR